MSSDERNNGSGSKAYITSDGRYIEPTDDEVQEELKKPRQLSKKTNETIISKRANQERQKSTDASGRKEKENADYQLEHEDDIFDEDGNFIEDENDAKQSLRELESKIEDSLNRLKDVFNLRIKQPLIKVRNRGLSFLSKFLNPVTFVLTKFTDIVEKVAKRTKSDDDLEAQQIEQNIPERVMVHGCFEDMINLNIIFTDNYDIAMYKKNRQTALAKTEENLINETALEAIKQCAEYTKDLPPITEGAYQGRQVSEIMENVDYEDLTLFLGYVKKRPQKYIAKSWKISETFATWLINNAPMVDENE